MESNKKKYQAGLDKTKDYLKKNPEPVIRDICDQAGLTDKETTMIVLKFRKGKQRDYLSYELGMSSGRFSVKMTNILRVLKNTLISLGFIDE